MRLCPTGAVDADRAGRGDSYPERRDPQPAARIRAERKPMTGEDPETTIYKKANAAPIEPGGPRDGARSRNFSSMVSKRPGSKKMPVCA